MKKIDFFQLTIEPENCLVRKPEEAVEILVALKVKIQVGSRLFDYKRIYHQDDFESVFHRMMDYAEHEIEQVVKEDK